MPIVQDHASQFDRIANNISAIAKDGFSHGFLTISNRLLFVLELLVFAVGAYHGVEAVAHWLKDKELERQVWIASLAFGADVFVLLVHAVTLSVEKSLHRNHERRIDCLQDEVRTKGMNLQRASKAYFFNTPEIWLLG
jgi:hypothetical protein